MSEAALTEETEAKGSRENCVCMLHTPKSPCRKKKGGIIILDMALRNTSLC